MGREQRLAQNEALFREVNERLRDVAALTGTIDAGVGFVCECSDEDCTERLPVAPAAYERVRAHPRRFVVAPGHREQIERVVEARDGYLVVEKTGEAGAVAEDEDPRRGD